MQSYIGGQPLSSRMKNNLPNNLQHCHTDYIYLDLLGTS